MFSDTEKMFRMVIMQPYQRNFQRVLYRSTRDVLIQEYVLKTVPFGETPASHLCVKTLHQLADDKKPSYPGTAKYLKKDFYVFSSARTKIAATILIKQMKIGFNQWSSKDPSLLDEIPEDAKEWGLFKIMQQFTDTTLGLM